MQYVELVAILAVLQFFFFGFMTGQARRDSSLKAPAISGAESFERMYRVQTNTMETLVAFLPSLLIAGKYWPPLLVAALGVVYIIGRFLYWQAKARHRFSCIYVSYSCTDDFVFSWYCHRYNRSLTGRCRPAIYTAFASCCYRRCQSTFQEYKNRIS